MAVTDNAKWLVRNQVDTATFVTNQVVSLPLSNIVDRRRSLRARFNATIDVNVQMDTGAIQAANVVAWCGTNLQAGATVTVHHSTDNFVTDDTLIETVTIFRPPVLVRSLDMEYVHFSIFDSISRRYWRIDMNDGGNPDGYLTLGRVFVGQTQEFTRNIAMNVEIGVVDPSKTDRSPSGTPYTDGQTPYRAVTLEYHYLQDADLWDNILDFAQYVGVKNNLWLLLKPTATGAAKYQSAFYGRFATVPGIMHQQNGLWNTKAITFCEDL